MKLTKLEERQLAAARRILQYPDSILRLMNAGITRAEAKQIIKILEKKQRAEK